MHTVLKTKQGGSESWPCPGSPTRQGSNTHSGDKQRKGPPTGQDAPGGAEAGRSLGIKRAGPASFHTQGGGVRSRERGMLPARPHRVPTPGWEGSEVSRRGPSWWQGHAPCRRGRSHHHLTSLHWAGVGDGHAVCFPRFHQRGGAKGGHTFHWETLTEDTLILELIQSWKQRPPEGDHVWGELAAALLRVW